ncbi:MAG: GDYXXLXY domain-containing protein [Cyanobacteria bacterium P01_E01_bin.6]
MMTSSAPRHGDRPISSWRFWLPLTLQIVCVLTIPAQALYTHVSGTSVILQTAPVDPYSLLQGYYVTLRYDISQIEVLKALPGWDDIEAQVSATAANPDNLVQATPIYLVLESPESVQSGSQPNDETPTPWRPVHVYPTYPSDVLENHVVIKGVYYGSRITYGLEQYYIPEAQRDEINERIRQVQQSGDRHSYVVEIKVASQGISTPVRLWVDGKAYQF